MSQLSARLPSSNFLFGAAVFGVVLVPLLLGLRTVLFAEPPMPTSSAVVSTVSTTVEVDPVGEPTFDEVVEDQVLVTGDTVRTAPAGRGLITFIDDSQLVLAPGSELLILPPARSGGGLINRFSQTLGSSWSQLSSVATGGGQHEIQTPNGVVSVRDGAVLSVGVGLNEAGEEIVTVIVLEGNADILTDGATAAVGAGQMITFEEGATDLVPEEALFPNQLTVALESPLGLLVRHEPSGLSGGVFAEGETVRQVPLSTVTGASEQPRQLTLLAPLAGTYFIHMLPRQSSASYGLETSARSADSGVFGYSESGLVASCQWLHFRLEVQVSEAGEITTGLLTGPFPTTALPVLAGGKVLSPCPDPQPVSPTPAPTPSPTPTATPTPAATPSPVPTPTATSAPTVGWLANTQPATLCTVAFIGFCADLIEEDIDASSVDGSYLSNASAVPATFAFDLDNSPANLTSLTEMRVRYRAEAGGGACQLRVRVILPGAGGGGTIVGENTTSLGALAEHVFSVSGLSLSPSQVNSLYASITNVAGGGICRVYAVNVDITYS